MRCKASGRQSYISRKRVESLADNRNRTFSETLEPSIFTSKMNQNYNNINLLLDKEKQNSEGYYRQRNQQKRARSFTKITDQSRQSLSWLMSTQLCNPLSKNVAKKDRNNCFFAQRAKPSRQKNISSFRQKAYRSMTVWNTKRQSSQNNGDILKRNKSCQRKKRQCKTSIQTVFDEGFETKNTINGTQLGVLSPHCILERTSKQSSLFSNPVSQPLQTTPRTNLLGNQGKHPLKRFQRIKLQRSDAVSKAIIGKYEKLLDSINTSDEQFEVADYDEYHQQLTCNRHSLPVRSHRRKLKAAKGKTFMLLGQK